jgi:hypothetical protein
MLDSETIIRFVSLISYIGFIISGITGFVKSDEQDLDDFKIALITSSTVVFIQNIAYLVIEMFRYYETTPFLVTNIFYIRAILMLESAVLCMGLSSVGIGFGVLGIIMFFVNMLAGVFLFDTHSRVAPFSNIEDQDNEIARNLD